MNLRQEIAEYKENQRTQISPDMFLLWEYKLFRKGSSKEEDLLELFGTENVHIRTNLGIQKLNNLNDLVINKELNKSLFNFCSKYISFEK